MSPPPQSNSLDLTVVIPALNEAENLRLLLPALTNTLENLAISWEILVIDPGSPDPTQEVVESNGAVYICEQALGYGKAIMRGVQEAKGRYIATMDADLSHPAKVIEDLWQVRGEADVTIASRYVPGGSANQPKVRLWLSKILNTFFRVGLSMDVKDMSSGYRLYNKNIFRKMHPTFFNFVILVEILLLAMKNGGRIQEIPFKYQPRGEGRSHAQVVQFGLDYLRLFYSMWRIRNSINFPDYDWRAYNSRIPLQRWWQRKRYRIIMNFTPEKVSTLDIGCGSSRILAALPHAVGADMRFDKLKFMRRTNKKLLQLDGCKLPFPDESFDCVICSEVIEHISDEGGRLLDEIERIMKKNGVLVLGTPDYGHWEWRVTELLYDLVAPGAYGDEHVTCYSFASLKKALLARGFDILDHAYIMRGELIFQARKRDFL